MNVPSHYQSAFFQALEKRDEVDLRVIYFHGSSTDRAEEGWGSAHVYPSFESAVDDAEEVSDMVAGLPDWQERIHIISGYFSSELIDFFCENKIQWCHWSEMPGIRLAELLGFRIPLFRLLHPLMLGCKSREGRRIRNHALGAFGQGLLARRAFRFMGVPEGKVADLYYSPDGLQERAPCSEILSFAKGRKVFLAVGALCRRKGIDVFLKAFSKLKTDDWCVVLCGLDRSGGAYQALAEKLGIADKVLFLGAYPVERIAEVYCAANVFVLPSRFDGWGAVLNEAASLGLPIIGTDLCGASWHIIDDARNGCRVRAGNVWSLAAALRAYVRNPDLADKHGSEARKLFRETFTPEENASRLVNALIQWTMEKQGEGIQ